MEEQLGVNNEIKSPIMLKNEDMPKPIMPDIGDLPKPNNSQGVISRPPIEPLPTFRETKKEVHSLSPGSYSLPERLHPERSCSQVLRPS